jgi:hypothetical protein
LSEAEADFVPTDSAAAVAAAIGRNLGDTQAVASRVRKASERVRQWSPAGIAAQYDALYRQIARDRKRTR